ncbi:hypothetical protein [Shigella phage ESh36]|nr:hypothetical protein [Shigella phage ESh16]URY15973.1 hypothetical protein [Shigella phage ESh36]
MNCESSNSCSTSLIVRNFVLSKNLLSALILSIN